MEGSRHFDWAGILQLGLQRLKLPPDVFWRLSPCELRLMLGENPVASPLNRQRLCELVAAFPDRSMADDTDRDAGRTDTGA